MKKFSQNLGNTFTAVAFAEQGEWDEAVKIAEGSYKLQAADGRKIQAAQKKETRKSDNRPRLRVESPHHCRPKPPSDLR